MQLEITNSNHTDGSIQQVRERFRNVLRRQAEEIQRLAQNLKSLQNEQRQLETEASQMLEHLESLPAGKAGTDMCSTIVRGIRSPDNATEQADGDEAQVGPQEATPQMPDVTSSTEEAEKTLSDARRFSKLLVSEIELYNRNTVEEGRRNRDLYQRLKKAIDRSRETYEKRFANTVANRFDYFHEELVRALAENDPLLLGTGYPGPLA